MQFNTPIPLSTPGGIDRKLNTSHEIWVADIYDECILGMDFLQKHECLVDLKKGILLINKEDIPVVKGRVPAAPSCCQVVFESTVTLPP